MLSTDPAAGHSLVLADHTTIHLGGRATNFVWADDCRCACRGRQPSRCRRHSGAGARRWQQPGGRRRRVRRPCRAGRASRCCVRASWRAGRHARRSRGDLGRRRDVVTCARPGRSRMPVGHSGPRWRDTDSKCRRVWRRDLAPGDRRPRLRPGRSPPNFLVCKRLPVRLSHERTQRREPLPGPWRRPCADAQRDVATGSLPAACRRPRRRAWRTCLGTRRPRSCSWSTGGEGNADRSD